jgi:DNA primase
MSGRIPKQFIDDLLARVDIVEIIDQYVPLKKAGANYKACCPFHDEKTPSFNVSQTKQFYHCFGCGANGSAIGFLIDFDHMHFVDAVEYLANRVGMQVPREAIAPVTRSQQALYDTLTACTAFYVEQLKNAPDAISYLQKRGITGETAREFKLGFAPAGWHTLESTLTTGSSDLLEAGMLVRNDSGRTHDRFRERIMYPIRDRRGRTIGFGGRIIGSGEPKYLNSPETTLFQKGREVYGLYELRRARTGKSNHIVVVEGYMDVIALAEHGLRNAVATLGTATNTDQVQLLFRETDEIIFCFDGDRAGRQAAWRALNAALPCLKSGRIARFLFLPDGEDPDSIVNQRGSDGFQALAADAIDAADFLLAELQQQSQQQANTPGVSHRARLAELGKPLVEAMPKSVYRSLVEQQLSELVGTQIFEQTTPAPPVVQAPPSASRAGAPSPVRKALAAIFEQPGIVLEIDPELYNFSDNIPGARLLMEVITIVECNPEITVSHLLEQFRDRAESDRLHQIASDGMLESETSAIEAPIDVLGQAIAQLNRESERRQVRELPLDKAPSQMTEDEKARLRQQISKLKDKSG